MLTQGQKSEFLCKWKLNKIRNIYIYRNSSKKYSKRLCEWEMSRNYLKDECNKLWNQHKEWKNQNIFVLYGVEDSVKLLVRNYYF